VKLWGCVLSSVKTVAVRSSGPSSFTTRRAISRVLITPPFSTTPVGPALVTGSTCQKLPSSTTITTTRPAGLVFVATSGATSRIHGAGGGGGDGASETALKATTGRGWPSTRTVKSFVVRPWTG